MESRFEQGGTASATQFQKDTTLVAGVRQYQPGDRFAWIDWKASARTNNMMSKEFELRQSNDLLFVLDRTPTDTFEEMVTFAASSVTAILQSGGQVGLYSVGAEKTLLSIKGGEMHQQQCMYHFAKVKSDSRVALGGLLKADGIVMKQQATLIIITSKLTRDLLESMGSYKQRKEGVHIFIIKKAGEKINSEEAALRVHATQRGFRVRIIDETNIQTVFSEVRRA
nr:DUF58 domain-containing protein [Bacillus sp. FJAT-50079]